MQALLTSFSNEMLAMLSISIDQLLLAIVFAPLLGAVAIGISGRALPKLPIVRDVISLLTAGSLAAAVAVLLPQIPFFLGYPQAGSVGQITLVDMLPGLSIAFQAEGLGLLFAGLAAGLWLVNTVYGIGYMRANKEPNQTVFFACFPVALTGVMGMAFAENLLTLFLFYELLTFSTYPLVTHKRSAAALKAGRTYMSILVGGSICLFMVAIIWTYALVGHVDFMVGGVFANSATPIPDWILVALLVLFVFGISKAALMPLHRWLPAAMIAPTPVSAFLHAVAVVKGGVFAVLKILVFIFGLEFLEARQVAVWLPWVAAFTIIAASIVALRADNLKRRLAYSTIGQLSYIVIATAVLAPLSPTAAGLHILAHGVSKITLFFAAGNIYTAAHKTNVSELDGIGRRMPITMLAFLIGSVSLIGLPLTVGLMSKELILQSAAMQGSWLVVCTLIISSLLNAAYFLPIVYRAFFCLPNRQYQHGEAPWPMLAAIMLTSSLVFAMVYGLGDVKTGLLSLANTSGYPLLVIPHIDDLQHYYLVAWESLAFLGMLAIWALGRVGGGRWGTGYFMLQLAGANSWLVLNLMLGHELHLSDTAISVVWLIILVQALLAIPVAIWLARRAGPLRPLPLTQFCNQLAQGIQRVQLGIRHLLAFLLLKIQRIHAPDGYLGHTVASGGLVFAVLVVFLLYLILFLL